MENDTDKADLSQKTVIVLVVLTVLISIFGTFAVLDASNSIKLIPGSEESPVSTAKVKLSVVKPPESQEQKNSAVGNLALNIVPAK